MRLLGVRKATHKVGKTSKLEEIFNESATEYTESINKKIVTTFREHVARDTTAKLT